MLAEETAEIMAELAERVAGGRVVRARAVLALPVMEDGVYLEVSHFLSLSLHGSLMT